MSSINCGTCGSLVELPANFCDMCGSPLNNPIPNRSPNASAERPESEVKRDKPMAENQGERTFIDNPFGVVTNKRVVYFRKKGWFSGGSRQDVPLRHVTSVRVETFRSIGLGIFLVLIGLVLLAFVIGIIPLIFGILLLWGSPMVVVNTTGGDREFMTGWPWHRQLAEDFAEALRKQLFRE